MRKLPTDLEGLFIVEFEPNLDDRGFFERIHCRSNFADLALDIDFQQSSLSYNRTKGTLRGLHLQKEPYGEIKSVQCLSGIIYDVVLDLRPSSPTYKKWQGFELSLEKHQALLIPAGCAHGFLTLTESSLVLYRMDRAFEPSAQTGVRWDDPTFEIHWPRPIDLASTRDLSWPDWKS